jgi:hypothetical protein
MWGSRLILLARSKGFFTAFAFLIQVGLLANFCARRWRPAIERKYGWVIYAPGIPALLLGGVSFAAGEPLMIWAAFLIFSAWAGFGYWIDIRKKFPWRSPPRWVVFIPHVALFVTAQFFFWIPFGISACRIGSPTRYCTS